MNILDQLKRYQLFFLVIIGISFINSVMVHDKVFHEIDSVLPYALLSDKSNLQVKKYVAYSYGSKNCDKVDECPGALISTIDRLPDWIIKKISQQDTFNLIHKKIFGEEIIPDDPVKIKELFKRIIDARPALSNIPLHGIYRLGLDVLIDKASINNDMSNILKFPLASTYTIGMSFLYGTIYLLTDNEVKFFEIATLLNVLLFHLAAILLFLTFKKLNFDEYLSIILSMFFLFSSSLYSYSFHLGSTNIGIFSIVVFFYLSATNMHENNYYSRMMRISSILFIFNYIAILLFLATFFCSLIEKTKHYQNHFFYCCLGLPLKTLQENKMSFGLVLLILLFFYQPGQGVRGEITETSDIPTYIYLFILNLFAWSNLKLNLIMNSQFILFSILVLIAIWAYIKNLIFFKKLDPFGKIITSFVSFYIILLLVGALNLTPSRHVLFLNVIILLLLLFQFKTFSKAGLSYFNKAFVLLLLCGTGLFLNNLRATELRSYLVDFNIPQEERIVVPSGFISPYYANYDPIETYEEHTRYTFLSTDILFHEWIDLNFKDSNQYGIVKEKLVKKVYSDISYMAFTPNSYFADDRFAFNRTKKLNIVSFWLEKRFPDP